MILLLNSNMSTTIYKELLNRTNKLVRPVLIVDIPIFYIVDVFAEKKYSGNQLAVFRFTQNLSEKKMQQIAKEMNFSETAFNLSDKKRDGGYDVKIFTPKTEVPFAGHPTLGTAFIIQKEIEKTSSKIL